MILIEAQIEGISNELAGSEIQDQINDMEALNERIKKLESDKLVQLNQQLDDLVPYK